jgi:thiol-disulfide isomerase/thioredoxin
MRYRFIAIALATAGLALGQSLMPAPVDPVAEQKRLEQQAADQKAESELNQSIMEANNSPIDVIHAFEQFLRRHPDTKQRAQIEKALVQNAMQINDTERIVLYGEKVLERETPDDSTLLDRLIRALVDGDDAERAKRAIVLSKRYEKDIEDLRSRPPQGHLTAVQWRDELDHAAARALALEARALGNAGKPDEAAATAVRSWQTCPTGEGAREAAHWLAQLNRNADAIEYLADAFTLEDSRTTDTDRAKDRARLGEIYRQVNGSEKGLGEVILAAYDRTAGLLSQRRSQLGKEDPNIEATKIADFRLPGLAGAQPLAMASLKGKTVVMDFWATWCVPCRALHPMIEEVRKRYEGASDVAFLDIDADDDPAVVPDFLKEAGWQGTGPFYFEGGLARQLVISSIPTVIVLDPRGQIYSRMIGFIPNRFEDMLAQRIDEARAVNKPLNQP